MNSTRREMLATLSRMLMPARKILGISRAELAKLSGLPENIIASAEDGTAPFREEHYLAIAAVLDSESFTAGGNLCNAVARLMAPEESQPGAYDDDDEFVLVRRWLDASYDDDSESCEGRVLTDRELEILAGECRIFADSTAISDENFPALMSRLAPFLKESGRRVIIPHSAVKELNEYPDDENDEGLSASDILTRIERFRREGLIEIRGNDDDGATSETLADVFRMYEGEYDFMLITQDPGLAGEFSGNDSVKSARINDKGDLVIWDFSGKNIDEWQLS